MDEADDRTRGSGRSPRHPVRSLISVFNRFEQLIQNLRRSRATPIRFLVCYKSNRLNRVQLRELRCLSVAPMSLLLPVAAVLATDQTSVIAAKARLARAPCSSAVTPLTILQRPLTFLTFHSTTSLLRGLYQTSMWAP